MLINVARSLGRGVAAVANSLSNATTSQISCQRTLSTGILGQKLIPTTTSLLAIPATHVISKRTWFDAMDENGRGETAKHGYGIQLYSPKDGKRTSLKAVELRFKRLDWGQWIRPRTGRDKKAWKKTGFQLRVREKHVFCVPYHKRRFDRAVLSELKEIRHIPDDPYKAYNHLSFQNYHSIKLKNMERIKKYGDQIYNFPWFRAHFKKNMIFSDKYKGGFYEPPNYHKDVADGGGVYTPDQSIPNNEPAPHYLYEQRLASIYFKRKEAKYWRKLRREEAFYGPIGPSHVLRLPVNGTNLG